MLVQLVMPLCWRPRMQNKQAAETQARNSTAVMLLAAKNKIHTTRLLLYAVWSNGKAANYQAPQWSTINK
jgi:hypothetical protein